MSMWKAQKYICKYDGGTLSKTSDVHYWCKFHDLKSRKHHWDFRVPPTSQHHEPAPHMPITDPPSPAADDSPPGHQLCPRFYLFDGITPLCSSFQWGTASSTLGRISILEYKTPQPKFLCSIAENFVEYNVGFTSCILKVALHGYAGRPDRGLLSSPAARDLGFGTWCRWGKCVFDVTKIGHAG